MDLLRDVAPLELCASDKGRGVHFRPWIVTCSAWYKQPPEHSGPSAEVRKTLAEDQELQTFFARLVDWGVTGIVEVCLWGTNPASPAVVVDIANVLDVPAPSQTASVRVQGYLAQLGLATRDYAKLRRYAKEAFRW